MESKEKIAHVVSFSGGKDSTAMLLMMVERGMPIDEIIFCDTGLEFPEMYDHIKKVEEYIGRKITIIKDDHDFKYYLVDRIRIRGKNAGKAGYGFPFFGNRWCTGFLKSHVIKRYNREKFNFIFSCLLFIQKVLSSPRTLQLIE